MAYEISEIRQEKLKQFSRRWGVCSTIQIPGHNFMDKYVDNMFEMNNNPEIEYKDHYWELVNVCKTQTWATRWVIRINSKMYAVIQSRIYKIGPAISIFETEDKKNGSCNISKPVKTYPGVVDIETACDFFAAEYMAQRILDGRFANIMDPQTNTNNE